MTLASARAAVDSLYVRHFAAGQGFSVDTLRARQAWFTPEFYALLLADMDDPEGGIGVIEADPFTGSQEEVASFAPLAARLSGDTAFIAVEMAYGPSVGSGHERDTVILAMLRARGVWQVADFLHAGRSLSHLLQATVPDRRSMRSAV